MERLEQQVTADIPDNWWSHIYSNLHVITEGSELLNMPLKL